MPSSDMLRRVTLVKIYVSEERSATIFRVKGMGELGTMVAISYRRTLRRNTIYIVHLHGIVFIRSVYRLLVTANIVPSSPTPVTLMMEAPYSSET
jgi:hypothetical protein